jgi:hypothetical protein
MNEVLRSGKYYLGDPSYVLPSSIYNGIWFNLYDFKNGKYDINDTDFVVHNTHYGDNIYKDTRNRSYNVSSGVISLVDVRLIENMDEIKNNGHIFNFKSKVNFIYDAGIFYIKSGKNYICIDTRNNEEYNSDYEDHCEDEDGEYIQKTICGGSDNDSINDEDDLYLNYDDDDEEDEDSKSFENKISEKTIFFKKKY